MPSEAIACTVSLLVLLATGGMGQTTYVLLDNSTSTTTTGVPLIPEKLGSPLPQVRDNTQYQDRTGDPYGQQNYGQTQQNYGQNFGQFGNQYDTSPRVPFGGGFSAGNDISGNSFYSNPNNALNPGRNTLENTVDYNAGFGFGLNGLEGLNKNSFCPEFWIANRQTCYRFIKSPKRNWYEAKKICQAYKAELVNVDNIEKHSFLLKELIMADQKANKYFVSAKQLGPNSWVNDDGSPLVSVEDGFAYEETDIDSELFQENLQDTNRYYNRWDPIVRKDPNGRFNDNRNYNNLLYNFDKTRLVYGFSRAKDRWMFIPVYEFEVHLFICESMLLYNEDNIKLQQDDQRKFDYGIEIKAEYERIPRGPYFVNQPNDTTFDTAKRKTRNDVTVSCYAAGYPTPTYSWFKEEYVNDNLTYHKIDPLSDSRYTISGGSLIIFNPEQGRDQGTYHCLAENKFGRIRSESVELNFGYIMEFNLKRSGETGKSNWGHAMFCDPPQRKLNWA